MRLNCPTSTRDAVCLPSCRRDERRRSEFPVYKHEQANQIWAKRQLLPWAVIVYQYHCILSDSGFTGVA
jgi:hypothetical protein